VVKEEILRSANVFFVTFGEFFFVWLVVSRFFQVDDVFGEQNYPNKCTNLHYGLYACVFVSKRKMSKMKSSIRCLNVFLVLQKWGAECIRK